MYIVLCMNKQLWYIYSLDDKIPVTQLKAEEFDVSKYDTTQIQQWMQKHAIQVSMIGDDAHYKLNSIVNKPFVMYSQGDLSVLDQPMLAIVGPRKPSTYIQQVMTDFFITLQQYHVVTISWGAPWVDTMAHEFSLEYSIPTVMVLWWGFAPYLAGRSRHLMDQIVQQWGCILSEFRLKQKTTKRTFPQRNRIVAGLADAVFLPWAAMKSWSLITVDFARQMHTPVCSVTASIYEESSAGTNMYIADRKIDTTVDFTAFLDTYFTRKNAQQKLLSVNVNEEQKRLLTALRQDGAMTVESLAISSELWVGDVMFQMMDLQLAWLVYESGVGERSSK